MNHLDLSRGLITCTVSTESPLTADAFRVLGYIADVIERYAADLDKAMLPATDTLDVQAPSA